FCYTCGTLMVAFSSPDIEGLLFPAIALIAVGGIVFLITNMQVANLFGNKRSTIITLYNGAFDSSSVVFLLVKVLYEAGLQLRTIFLFISCLSVLHILRTYILLPRTQIPYPLPEGYTYGASGQKFGLIRYVEANASQKQALAAAGGTEEDKAEEDKAVGQEETETIDALNVPLNEQKEPDAEGKEEEEEEEVPSFRRCVLSTLFFSNLFWLSVMQLRHYMFIGTLNPMLGLLAKGNMGLVSQYTNAFAVTQFFGIFCAPWNGLLMDRHKRKAKTTDAASDSVASNRLADMKSTVLSLAVTAMQCVLFSVCAAIPVLTVQYVTFILQVINRSFMYGGNAAFIAIT
uniref:equilibrative nucleobase transporter 1-like n=1 Tax=Pristiophorus japonicus TaxID=55135 RepID=UPI00398F84C9